MKVLEVLERVIRTDTNRRHRHQSSEQIPVIRAYPRNIALEDRRDSAGSDGSVCGRDFVSKSEGISLSQAESACGSPLTKLFGIPVYEFNEEGKQKEKSVSFLSLRVQKEQKAPRSLLTNIRSQLSTASTNNKLSCEGFGNSGLLNPVSAAKAIDAVSCVEEKVNQNHGIRTSFNTEQCNKIIESADDNIRRRTINLAKALGMQVNIEILDNKMLYYLYDFLVEKAYDSSGNLRSGSIIDPSWLGKHEIRSKMPICVDLRICSNEASDHSNKFLVGLSSWPGRSIDEFVPPGW